MKCDRDGGQLWTSDTVKKKKRKKKKRSFYLQFNFTLFIFLLELRNFIFEGSLLLQILQHKRAGFPRPFLPLGARFRSRTLCRLASLALCLSVHPFYCCPPLLFLFSVSGGHPTVASSILCLAANFAPLMTLSKKKKKEEASITPISTIPCLYFFLELWNFLFEASLLLQIAIKKIEDASSLWVAERQPRGSGL